MTIHRRSLVPPLLLAAAVLAASAVSLRSAESLSWALAGPFIIAATVVALRPRRGSRSQWFGTLLLASAIFLSGAMVALADPADVPLMMPILASCAAVSLFPRSCKKVATGDA